MYTAPGMFVSLGFDCMCCTYMHSICYTPLPPYRAVVTNSNLPFSSVPSEICLPKYWSKFFIYYFGFKRHSPLTYTQIINPPPQKSPSLPKTPPLSRYIHKSSSANLPTLAHEKSNTFRIRVPLPATPILAAVSTIGRPTVHRLHSGAVPCRARRVDTFFLSSPKGQGGAWWSTARVQTLDSPFFSVALHCLTHVKVPVLFRQGFAFSRLRGNPVFWRLLPHTARATQTLGPEVLFS